MKAVRYIIQIALAVLGLCAPANAWAQTSPTPPTTTPPVTVTPPNAVDLAGVPGDIKALLRSFALTRDKFLAEQDLLRIKLNHATTPSERERIREELQANRKAFLAAQSALRLQLKDELAALKGKISHEEFLRILDAAHNAATEGGIGHHKGH
jgi:hypothetical protein